ncbi:MAG TPA: hypothetical protein VEL07_09715 [Planctomycetota bacterium]|nr:hypothetical protein [Planctomycetota bacterium]
MRAIAFLTALVLAAASAGEAPLLIAGFEDGTPAPFEVKPGMRIAEENATEGTRALVLEPDAAAIAWNWSGLVKDWSRHDVFCMDVFLPGTEPAQIALQIRDAMDEPGYWAWHNRYTALAPGRNTVQFSVGDIWRGEVLRRDVPGMLDTSGILRLVIINSSKTPIHIDNVRLQAFAAPKVEVAGMKAFDIEPAGAPGFPGFTSLTDADAYDPAKGYGWKAGSRFANTNRDICIRLHPDNLFRDWLSLNDAELLVDVPNGDYRVWLQLEDPGAWEFMQNYRRRTVAAEGAVVVDQAMGSDDFLDRYFRNQDTEDRPGDDPFARYVETRHPWTTFGATVADGQLSLRFRSEDAYGATLSAAIIVPAGEAAAAERYLAYVAEARRFDWAQAWKPISKPPTAPTLAGPAAAAAKRDGFALRPASAYVDGDYSGAAWGAAPDAVLEKLSIAAALGETEPATFGLLPARELGKVSVSVSALRGPGGAAIPADRVQVRVGRFRFSRHGGDQSGLYNVVECELRSFNRTAADELRCDDGLARRFWVIVDVPADAKPGAYAATVSVQAEKGGKREVPLAVEVLPFALPPAGHAFSVYGCEVVPMAYYPEQAADRARQIEIMLRDLASHGMNYIGDAPIGPRCEWKGDEIQVTNADELDAAFALRRELGFLDLPVAFPSSSSPLELADGTPIGGRATAAAVGGWYGALTRTAAQRGWPHPYFCFGDEPNVPETMRQLTGAHNALHAVSADLWTGIAYDMGEGKAVELVKTLDVHHLKEFCSVDDFKAVRPIAKLLLNCNVGFGRMPFGLREWRAAIERKTDGAITYAYTGSHVDIYYHLDARERDFSCSPPRRDGSRDTTQHWELTREGVDDFRYARAVKNLADDAKAPAARVAAAKALLEQAYAIGGERSTHGYGLGGEGGEAIDRAIAWRRAAQELLAGAAR